MPYKDADRQEAERRVSTFTPGNKRGERLQAAVIALGYRLLNGLLRLAAIVFWPSKRPKSAQSVLIYRIGNIGDVTCALPAMRAIRRAYPDARLTLLTSPGPKHLPGAKELLQDIAWIDEIRTYYPEEVASYAGRWRLLKDLRQRRIDLWFNLSASAPNLNLPREFRDMLFARLVGPRWARGWTVDAIVWGAQAQSLHLGFPGEADRLLNVIRQIGIDPQPVEFGLPILPVAQRKLDELTARLGQVPWIAIAPGCKRSTNRWPIERFAEVARVLTEQGFSVMVIGGPGDAESGQYVVQATDGLGLNLAGRLSLVESIEALRRCQLAICVDSGIQHLASAVGTPTLSLFSAWQMRGKWYPHGTRNRVIQKLVPCHTCLLDTCPHDNRCMDAITTEEVINEVRESFVQSADDDQAAA